VRATNRPIVAAVSGSLLGGLLIAGVVSATTTPRTLESITTDWPAQASILGARISADGHVVAFAAEPTIAGVASGSTGQHVFIRDLATSAIEQVSVDSSETGRFIVATPGGVSADGRFVSFRSWRLDPYTMNEQYVYVRDRVAGTTDVVNVPSIGQPDESCGFGATDISGDGRYVAFTCAASNLLPVGEDQAGFTDVFLRDRQEGTTIRVNVPQDGGEADDDSFGVAISEDGSTVVFDSWATNLLADDGDQNGVPDVFAYDIASGTLERVSVADDEDEGNAAALSDALDVNADGSVVAFTSAATNLTLPFLSNPSNDVYVRDRTAGTTVRASVNDAGTRPNVSDGAFYPSISADGTRVAFASRAALDPGKTSPWADVFLRDLAAGTTEMLSRTAGGLGGDNVSGDSSSVSGLALDGSGQVVAFITYANDLAPEPFDDWYPDVVVSSPAPADGDGDGISDDIDTGPGGASNAFSDGTTFGTIVSVPAGFSVQVSDAVGVDEGVRIVVTGSGTQKVQFSLCGLTVRLPAGADVTATCGSVILEVAAGSPPVEVVIGGLAVVSIGPGVTAEVDQAAGGGFTVDNVSGGSVSVTVDGQTTTVTPGSSLAGYAWDFVGFKQPVDNGGVPNIVKAGRSVPIKWHLADASGAPITSLATAKLTVASLSCPTGVTGDQLEEYTTGSSGLVNDGHGDYHMNWQTPSSYANSCKTLRLDIGDGVLHTAVFSFTK